MGAYQENLRHVAEPAAPSERDKAVSTSVKDYAALWFTEPLREFAHYGDPDDERQSEIAVAYTSYIDAKVRDEGKQFVEIYAHTKLAADTLLDALYDHVPDDRDQYPLTTFRYLEESFAETVAPYLDHSELDNPGDPAVDEELGVVFDVREARESYADMKIAEAESEYEARIEEELEGRGVRNLPESRPARYDE